MFEIDEQNLPFVRTRKALLVLDLQNDFISTGCILPVENPPNFLHNIFDLLPYFRVSGNVIWIRSVFESSRAINDPQGDSESVVTDVELPLGHRKDSQAPRVQSTPSPKLLERHGKISVANGRGPKDTSLLADDEDECISETYLTIESGQIPFVVLAMSPGANFSQEVIQAIDSRKDLVFQKNFYSAFKDGRLVQTLRAKFVTEIYLCGALTNISVFATAMDAARHGYAITIVEDCLGYRSKARHDEAIRQLREFTGCDIMCSADLIRDLRGMVNSTSSRDLRPKENDSGLENMMAHLNLRPDGRTAVNLDGVPTKPQANVTVAETAGSTDSLLPSESLQEMGLPAKSSQVDDRKKKRVKTRIKARRRRSKSIPEDTEFDVESGGPSKIGKGPTSPTSATLQAASQALEKFPTAMKEEDCLGGGGPVAREALISHYVETGQKLEICVKSDSVRGSDVVEQKLDNASAVSATASISPTTPSSQLEQEYGPQVSAGLQSIPLCEGDTTVVNELLDGQLRQGIFEKVRDEVRWQKMSHQGGEVPRLVAVQGEVAEDGSIPIYRHPADESPPLLQYSPTVSLIRAQVEKQLGHAVNHVLIQFYRDGTDYISEHSDKTLDIVPGTFIANVSLGAQRTMIFRTKKPFKLNTTVDEPRTIKPRQVCKAPLPHNSMCKVGLVTNMRWLHGIRQDKRLAREKSEAELAYNGERISLTFRMIGTFLDKDQKRIWGQGAIAKTRGDARTVVNGDAAESEKMIRAFGKENHGSEFNWTEIYGDGFDVLHISNSPKLYLSGDRAADLRVKIMLAEYGITWTQGTLSPSFNWKDSSSSNHAPNMADPLPLKFMDNDLSKSIVIGDEAIMLYLDAVYGSKFGIAKSAVSLARQFTRFQQSNNLLKKWRGDQIGLMPFRRELQLWDAFAAEEPFIAGSTISLADFALWPILNEIWTDRRDDTGLENLRTYYDLLKTRDGFIKALGP